MRRHLGSGSSPSDSTAKDGLSSPARHRRHWAAWNVPSQVRPAPGSAVPRVGHYQPAPRIEPRRPSPPIAPATIANHPLWSFFGFCTLAERTLLQHAAAGSPSHTRCQPETLGLTERLCYGTAV